MSNEQVAPETKGVTVKLLSTVDLGPEIEGMERRQLRMRMVTIEPGGVFGPIHDHKDRPGTVYILQGTITDHRNGVATDYGPGVGWPEDRNTTHWLENRERFRRWRSRSISSGKSESRHCYRECHGDPPDRGHASRASACSRRSTRSRRSCSRAAPGRGRPRPPTRGHLAFPSGSTFLIKRSVS